jgi:hypothetical protein
MPASKEVFRPVPGGGQRVNPVIASSAAISLGISDESIDVARLYNKKATDVYVRFGNSAVGAATTTTDIPIPSGQAYDIAVQGFTHFRHIGEDAAAGDLVITLGTYVKV